MFYIRCLILLLLIPCYQGCNADSGSMFTFINAGQKEIPKLIVASSLTEPDRIALNTLQDAFNHSIGIQLQVVNEKNNMALDGSAIYFGNTLQSKQLHLPHLKKDGYAILQQEKSIYIYSETSRGLMYAVSDFIETYLHGFKPDEGEVIYTKLSSVTLPVNLKKVEEPAFEFRQAYFPASNKLAYQNWHRTHHLEQEWGCWGHHLGDLLKKNNGKISSGCFAMIHGERNDEQFCFSSEILYQEIKHAIQHELSTGNTFNKWMIAANDNILVCECDQCKMINANHSASNTLVQLLNKLANDFPSLQLSTLAYASTYQPPTQGKLASNCMVMLSTIDMPKGVAIQELKTAQSFNAWVNNWKLACNNLYVWDYPIQYTNYMDVFPNLNALQKDLQYFKKLGINGVFEQGTEYQYGLFAEWKCYAISKLLWNPDMNLAPIRTSFFQQFYGPIGKRIEEFYSACEQHVMERKKTLDIYGNVQLASAAYLDYNELASILSELHKFTSTEENKNPRIYYNVHKLQTCLDLLMLQYQRWKGIDKEGYAEPIDATSWRVKPELIERIQKIKKACIDDEIETWNENGELVQTYLSDYEKFLNECETKNLLWKKAVMYHTNADDSYPANGKLTLVDGVNGTNDYSFNWQLFNNTSMDISIDQVDLSSAELFTIRFLHDPAHYIFLPKTIHIYAGTSPNDAKLVKTFQPIESRTMLASISTFSMKLDPVIKKAAYIKILADGLGELPSWKSHPTKKPTLACDEINIK